MSDPFTDFMTGEISKKIARFDTMFYAFLYFALATAVLSLGAVILFT